MKRNTFFLCLLLVVVQATNAQLSKGNWLVGGSGSFSSTQYKSTAGTQSTGYDIKLSPNVGYFIAEKFATGLKVSFGRSGGKAIGTSTYSTYTDASFGPFLRYYLLSADRQFNILTEGIYQYGLEGGNREKNSKNTFSLAAGPVIYFNESVGLELLIGYSSFKYLDFDGRNNTIQFSLGLQVHLEKQ